ncbi:hypothetical protein UlMin_009258 [Ulmus minor]
MKSHPLSSSSSSMSSSSVMSTPTPATAAEEDHSCYYPGCRKDANCKCKICLASINATLDLFPKSTLTKLSASRPNPNLELTPISFNSSSLRTPVSGSPRVQMSPCLRSSGRVNLKEKKVRKKKREWELGIRIGSDLLKPLLILSFIFVAEFGLSWVFSGIDLKPELSPNAVRNLGERASVLKDLNGKIRFLQNDLMGLVRGKVSNCSYANSKWEINQDGLLLSSHCTLYKSSMEEIRIWGWPLQTAGLLTTGFSPRSFTVISGRVTEWSDGNVGYVVRKANSSWAHQKWGASAVQFDPNTWILEYRRSSILENPRLVSATMAFLKYRVSKMVSRMEQEFLYLSAFGSDQHYVLGAERHAKVPT